MQACEKYREMMSAYIDNMLSQEDIALLEKHLDICEECAEEMALYKMIMPDLLDLPMIELPEGFHERVIDKIMASKDAKDAKKEIHFNVKSLVSTAAAVIACFVLLGSAISFADSFGKNGFSANSSKSAAMVMGTAQNSAQASSQAPMAESFTTGPVTEEVVKDQGDDSLKQTMKDATAEAGREYFSVVPPILQTPLSTQIAEIKTVDERVLIKNYNITIVSTDVKNSVELLKDYVSDVDSSNISADYANISFKSDEAGLVGIIADIGSFGEIRTQYEYANDVTDSVNDAAIRYGEKDAEAARLIKLIEKAEKAEDIIILEGRITYLEIEKARLKASYINNLNASEATAVNISVVKKDVFVEPVEESFSSRIQSAFASSVNFTSDAFAEILVGISALILPLIIIAFICALVFFIAKRFGKRGGNDEN